MMGASTNTVRTPTDKSVWGIYICVQEADDSGAQKATTRQRALVTCTKVNTICDPWVEREDKNVNPSDGIAAHAWIVVVVFALAVEAVCSLFVAVAVGVV